MNHTFRNLDIPWLKKNIKPSQEETNIVIFDIDGTIMDTAPRNFHILQEAENYFPYLKGIRSKICQNDIGWNFTNAVKKEITLTSKQQQDLNKFWKDRFFYNEWLIFDTPYPRIQDILNWFIQNGIMIVYLTGRDKINMKNGTIDSFINYNIPIGEGTSFIFKPSQDLEDLEFKKDALKQISKMGNILLAVENEPANANAMFKAFPEAFITLIDTVTSPNPVTPLKEILLFKNY